MADLIEREKVVEILRIIGHGRPISGKRAISLICDMPTAEQSKQRHGRWIENRTDLICSACKWSYSDELPFMSNHGLDTIDEAFAYCPHCGSRMDAADTNVLTNEGGVKNDNE